MINKINKIITNFVFKKAIDVNKFLLSHSLTLVCLNRVFFYINNILYNFLEALKITSSLEKLLD